MHITHILTLVYVCTCVYERETTHDTHIHTLYIYPSTCQDCTQTMELGGQTETSSM